MEKWLFEYLNSIKNFSVIVVLTIVDSLWLLKAAIHIIFLIAL